MIILLLRVTYNIIVIGDLCDTFSLQNIITRKTFYKSNVGTSIDIMLTNKPKSFYKTRVFESGI